METVAMCKPYSKKKLTDDEILFNYRLSRERLVTGNVIGIWTIRFRIFVSRANLTPDKAAVVVMAALALHSFFRFESHQALGRVQGSNLITRLPVTFGSKIDKTQ